MRYGDIIVGICCIILFAQVEACDKFIPISHTEKTCTNDKCQIRTTEELFISPTDKLICIVASEKDRIIAKIRVEIDYAFMTCERGPTYYTYNSSVEIGYAKKCYGNSLCDDKRCDNVDENTKLDDFGKVNNMLGISKCVTSSGGWNSLCWSFKSACLFYRIGAKKNNDKLFEVFECEHWTKEIVISITVESENENQNEAFKSNYLLKEGEKDLILDPIQRAIGTVELISIEEGTPVKAMRGKFVKNGPHVSTVIADGTFKTPLVCDENEKCQFENTCECEIGSDQPFCKCDNYDLFSLTKDGLPMITPHYHLVLTKNNDPAIKHFHPRAHIQIELNSTFDMTTTFNNESCEITDYTQVRGCYNCYEAATFNITCKAKVRSSALISCNNREFIDRITCDTKGYANIIRKRFNTSVVSQTCLISCGKRKKAIEITGSLHYQPPDIIKKLYSTKNDNFAEKHIELHFQRPDFLQYIKTFTANIRNIVGTTVLIAIILFILFKFIIPYIVKLVR